MEIFCFFAGTAFVYTGHLYLLCFVLVFFYFRPNKRLFGWFFLALAWSLLHQWWIADQHMPSGQLIKNAKLQGYIDSIPSIKEGKTQFQFHAVRLDGKPVHARILLTCFKNCPSLLAGQYWRVVAKLQKPMTIGNPGGFDYAQWLAVRHIAWTGSVLRGSLQHLDTYNPSSWILAFRQHLAQNLALIDPETKTLGILQALTLGVSNRIENNEWELFRRTGTIHLMVISGAHIGLVAGLTYWLVKRLWGFCGRAPLLIPAPRVGSVAALFMALLYTVLAGFAVPAQRALVVCFFLCLRHFCNCKYGVWQAFRYALLAVLIIDPHAVLQPGFYLSFIAVAVLLLGNERFPLQGMQKTVVLQFACLFGLMPLTLFWFSYGAVNGVFANLLAIPWVGFVIVPLSLLITLLSQWVIFPWMVFLLKKSILFLLWFLSFVDAFAFWNLNYSFTHLLTPLALMSAMGILLFLPIRSLYLAVFVLVFAGLFPRYERVKAGALQVDVLDVGQGLSVIVRTQHHVLIYDTGGQFYRGSDMGQRVIIPYLKTLGVQTLDKIIISHPDLDHRGGLASLEKSYPVKELLVDDPIFYKRGHTCHEYPPWIWDGVLFRFFPISQSLGSKNNRSCVLQMATQHHKMLLTGDIEKAAEQYLQLHFGEKLRSSVMVVPHHASKTSSSPSFLRKVAPRYAIASFGFDNRYRFPHAKTLATYQKYHIPMDDTVNCGMVRVLMDKGIRLSKPSCYR